MCLNHGYLIQPRTAFVITYWGTGTSSLQNNINSILLTFKRRRYGLFKMYFLGPSLVLGLLLSSLSLVWCGGL